MTLESDAKFEVKLTCGLENDLRNLTNFYQSTLVPIIQSRKFMSLKLIGELCVDIEEWCKTWKGTDSSVQNWHGEFNKFWPEQSKISKMCTFMGCFWPKYIMFELIKYKGVMFDDTEGWYKVWMKTNLRFQKWHEEFGKVSPGHLKV